MEIFMVYIAENIPKGTSYSYGLGYVSSMLVNAGYNVTYFVIKTHQDRIAFVERVKSTQPRIIGFSVTTSQFYSLKKILNSIRYISSGLHVAGGVHPTLSPECILEIPNLHAVVRGEGEFPFLELAKAIEKGEDFHNIKNFWFKNGDTLTKNEIRPLIQDLDILPFPDKESVDYQQLINDSGGQIRYIFSRGCPYRCTYCCNQALSEVYNDKKNYFRLRSPHKAIEEISRDEEKYNFDLIIFDDDIITLNKTWFFDFFERYKARFNYPFYCNLRPGTFNEDHIKLLKNAGAKLVAMGVEHGNENFRKKILKRTISNQQIINSFKLCHKNGLRCWAQVIVGFPYETKKLYLDTVKLCRDLRLNINHFIQIFQPYPGTELGRLCDVNNIQPATEGYTERIDVVFSMPGFSKEEIQLCRDTFPILTQKKYIPLFLPLEWVSTIDKSVNEFRRKVGPLVPEKTKQLFRQAVKKIVNIPE